MLMRLAQRMEKKQNEEEANSKTDFVGYIFRCKTCRNFSGSCKTGDNFIAIELTSSK
jgi:hypothetical protein